MRVRRAAAAALHVAMVASLHAVPAAAGEGSGHSGSTEARSSALPSRVRAIMLTGGRDVLVPVSLGLPALRLVAVRMPRGLRVERARSGDRIVGRARTGRQVAVVRARRLDRSADVPTRLRVVIVGRRPAARRGTVLVSRGRDGQPANAPAWSPMVSSAGSTVVYSSSATNLVRRRLGPGNHLFAWDRGRRRGSELVGVSPAGVPVRAVATDVSADGRQIIFHTGDGLAWLRDRDQRTTVPVPVDAELSDEGDVVPSPAVAGWTPTGAASDDARFVVLASTGDPAEGQPPRAVFRVWDNVTGRAIHTIDLGEDPVGDWEATDVTGEGRFLLATYGEGIAGGWVHDLVASAEVGAGVAISDDARWIARQPRGEWDLALDERTGPATISLLLRRPPGEPRHAVLGVSVSRAGAAVAYDHELDLLVRGFRSEVSQVYLWRRG